MKRELPKDWRENFKLSDNFWLSEFYVSDTHPEIAAQITPTVAEINSLHLLCRGALQPIRNEFGRCTVTSGVRRSELNKLLGGARGSQHELGEACDFLCQHVDMMTVYSWILSVLRWDGEVIFYAKKGHIHIALPSLWVVADQFIKGEKDERVG